MEGVRGCRVHACMRAIPQCRVIMRMHICACIYAHAYMCMHICARAILCGRSRTPCAADDAGRRVTPDVYRCVYMCVCLYTCACVCVMTDAV